MVDEIKTYQTGRWVAPPEACWRLFGFTLTEKHPNVVALQLHLPNFQYTSFKSSESLQSVVANPRNSRTMLIEFFRMNATNELAKKLKLLYCEYPQYFVWNTQIRQWTERKRSFAIGRIVSASPLEGERYFARMLLQARRCPDFFQYLGKSNDIEFPTFRESAVACGLLESNTYLESALTEAASYQMPHSLRRLFATILVYCSPAEPMLLWEKFKCHMTDDLTNYDSLGLGKDAKGLQLINDFLVGLDRSLNEFNIIPDYLSHVVRDNTMTDIQTERNIQILDVDLMSCSKLNCKQKQAFDLITAAIALNESHVFFIDGPAGTGKTFLYRALLAHIRSHGFVALAVATSGVATSLLRTTHSRFKLPIDLDSHASCNVSKQSGLAKLILETKIIIWDEISMAHNTIVHALDVMLKDITNIDLPFGGKIVVFGGDFR